MKRKEVIRLLDEVGDCIVNTSAECKVNGKDFDLRQIQAGIATGIAFASVKLKDDAKYPDSVEKAVSDLCVSALEGYLKFFDKGGDE